MQHFDADEAGETAGLGARRAGAAILARDTDMNRIAEILGIDLDETSMIP